MAGTTRLYQAGEWWVYEIRGARDVPGYDPREVGRGLSDSARRREVEGDWSASFGKLVYPEFSSIHVAQESLEFDPSRPLILGWDFGGTPVTGTPACVPTQLNLYGQWLIYPGLVGPEDGTIGIHEFSQQMQAHLQEEFAAPNGLDLSDLLLVHYGDPAGSYKPPATGTNDKAEMRSCYEIIKSGQRSVVGLDDAGNPVVEQRAGTGWVIQRGEVTLSRRMEAMRDRLNRLIGGLPALVVDPEATEIIDAFQGGYHYHQRADGRYELDPQKNHASHTVNALEYVASRLGSVRMPVDEEDLPLRRPTVRGAGRRLTERDMW